METQKELLESFEGPNGKAELYELLSTDPARPGIEKVEYLIEFKGQTQSRLTMGEASVLACDLAGDARFMKAEQTGNSGL